MCSSFSMQYGKCGGAVCSSQCPGRRGPSAGACRIFLGFLNIRHFLAPRITDENADIITATCLGLRQGHVLVLMRNRAPRTRRLTFRGIMQTTGMRMVYKYTGFRNIGLSANQIIAGGVGRHLGVATAHDVLECQALRARVRLLYYICDLRILSERGGPEDPHREPGALYSTTCK